MRRKRKQKGPKKLSKDRVKKFGETLGEKTEVEIFDEVKKAVETSWKKPLRLHEDTVEVMWEATRSDAGIASACKGLFNSLLEIFRTEKGSDRSPKLLSKWLVVTSDILNNDDHELTRSVRELCVASVSQELKSVAISFGKKLTSCLAIAVKDVFWSFVYSKKVSEENLEQEQSPDRQSRHQSTSGTEDLISIYRLGSSALFRIKRTAWKKLKLKPRKTEISVLKRSVRVVEALEEKDRNEIPSSVNHQNRNLLVMKKELVTPIQEFTNAFGAVVNFRGYKTYGNNLFKVAESQLLSNLDVKYQLYKCIANAGVKESKTVLNPFLKEFLRKLFNIKCKAFLKSLEILEEEKQGKSLQRDTMLRAKLKVYGLDKKRARK